VSKYHEKENKRNLSLLLSMKSASAVLVVKSLMSINDHKKARRGLMTAILTTLLISGTATTAALSFQTGSVYGQGQATLRVVKQVICELPSICPIQDLDHRITVTSSNPNVRPDPASFPGSSEGTTVRLGLGTFSVTETAPNPPAGLLFRSSFIGCTGSFIAPGQTRTCRIINAYLAPGGDTDGDRLRNDWEINGIDQNNDGRIDFRIPGANPLHKNLYVEIDYMQFHQPLPLDNVTAAFANAPVTNPDGITGVTLTNSVDEQIPHAATTSMDNLRNNIRPLWFGTAAERADPNSVNLLAAKARVFHYTLYAHQQPGPLTGSGGSSGLAETPGMNALVTLGAPGWGQDRTTGHSVGTSDQQEGTFIHEFGHNLGLQHGGQDETNCEVNYLSVLSYLFQFSNYLSTRPLDYSRSALATLNESALNETSGLSESNPPGLNTTYGPADVFQRPPAGPGPGFRAAGSGPIDWNWNGVIDPGFVSSNINRLGGGCNGVGEVLTGFDDWSNLVYLPTPPPASTAAGASAPLQGQPLQGQELDPDPEDEVTIDDVRASRLVLLSGIDNAILRLGGSIDLSPIAVLLQTDQLEAAIAELIELKEQVIDMFGEEAANREVVPQIVNLIGALEKQINPSTPTPPSPPSPPPASACIGTGNRDSRIIGTPGPDTIIGTDGHNIISGLGGDDSINGCGNVDSISGNAGNDGIAGGPARDRLHGDEGDDIVQGDAGDDVIFGDAGVNTLTGGPGRDIFFCSPEGETTITDFVPGVDRFSGPCMRADGTSSASEEAGASASDTSASDTSASDTSASDTSASDTRNGFNAQDRSGSDVSADIERDRTYKALEKRLERD
jgi:hypothetical protein